MYYIYMYLYIYVYRLNYLSYLFDNNSVDLFFPLSIIFTNNIVCKSLAYILKCIVLVIFYN